MDKFLAFNVNLDTEIPQSSLDFKHTVENELTKKISLTYTGTGTKTVKSSNTNNDIE